MNGVKAFVAFLDSVPWLIALAAALTLGLAPFAPMPHIVEKLQMLWAGALRRPLDIFDFCLHGAPWLLLALKGAARLIATRP
ncbi:MAG: RND transporter [Elusimicrobiota bacterium]|nr:RND transporter [Elusimicrobiota bacterium]